jgi:iron-only hydrogenase group A
MQKVERPIIEMQGFVRDENLCMTCGRCVQICDDVQTVHALSYEKRGLKTRILFDTDKCINCGQCIHACPVAALRDNEIWVEKTREALRDPAKHVVLQVAPAVRVALGEEFGMPRGTNVIGKVYTAARMIGFDMIGDTNFTADLTILEEGTELITRITTGGVLPQITTCSPGWIDLLEKEYPDLISHASTCKSPQQMFGALAKTYYAKEKGIDPANIVVVSVMPCTAKHFGAARPEMKASKYRDVDYVLTTREFARMIREEGIDLPALPDEKADSILGEYTGAATIFGTTGGVMEAALRTAYEVITKTTLEKVDFHALRTFDGIKEAEVQVGDVLVRVAVAHGIGNARVLLEQIRRGESPYHFIEIMTCPGGCVGGGGQPRGFVMKYRAKRAEGLFLEDANLPRRKSQENPEVKAIYEKFLGEPNSKKAHELLHTHYRDRSGKKE